jgi:hypothetical protein
MPVARRPATCSPLLFFALHILASFTPPLLIIFAMSPVFEDVFSRSAAKNIRGHAEGRFFHSSISLRADRDIFAFGFTPLAD